MSSANKKWIREEYVYSAPMQFAQIDKLLRKHITGRLGELELYFGKRRGKMNIKEFAKPDNSKLRHVFFDAAYFATGPFEPFEAYEVAIAQLISTDFKVKKQEYKFYRGISKGQIIPKATKFMKKMQKN